MFGAMNPIPHRLAISTVAAICVNACDAPPSERSLLHERVAEVAVAGSCLTPDGDACGEQSPSGDCYCDDGCVDFGDCCADKVLVCDCDCADLGPDAPPECVESCAPDDPPAASCGDLAGGALTFEAGASLGLTSPTAIVAADFDADGAADLVVLDRFEGENHLLTYRGDGAGGFTLVADRVEALFLFEMVAGDVNADGLADLVVLGGPGVGSTTRVSILLGAEDGSFAAPSVYTSLANSRDVILADIDADADLDLVVAAPQHVSVRRNTAGAFGGATNLALNTGGVHRVDATDLEADGDVDLLVSHDLVAGGVTILRNPGNAVFGAQQFMAVGSGTDDVLARDLNNDGWPEIAALRWVGSKVISVRFNLVFLWTDPVILPAGGTEPRRLEANDFDCDALLDLVTVSATGSAGSGFGVHPSRGDGSFEAPTYVDVFGMADVAIADFDSDGAPDVAAVRNAAGILDPELHGVDLFHARLSL